MIDEDDWEKARDDQAARRPALIPIDRPAGRHLP